MPCFRSQLLSRVWWCVFILDRRMAIESGRPFLIQRNSTDTLMPLELSDGWLGRFAGRTDAANMLEPEIEMELSGKHTTTIPYLVAMVRYSHVVGKAWELVYGLKAASNQTVSHMIDYADTVLSNLLEALPEDLTYNPDLPTKTQFGTRKRWQVKQTMLLSTIRHPRPPPPREEENKQIWAGKLMLIFTVILVCHISTYPHPEALCTGQRLYGPDKRQPARVANDMRKPGIKLTQRAQELERQQHEVLLPIPSLPHQLHHDHD